ncbi:precorrin-3B synthase [Paraburkholderia acidipaludis]|uniref:precorrin-3B synthase n=1 Tax=Paraburkholderia acidipaludis TaxID=660537 RepID=UPI000AF27776|nr:precorrin-3B synthase [Paraburkholderia acidipaludis]
MKHNKHDRPIAAATDAARRSACPGLLRVVAARDGGLCRIRLPGGVLASTEAHAVAEAARAHASGVIELTNRANVQLRGVRAGHERALGEALLRAGLGPDTPAPASGDDESASTHAEIADDLRNLMLSPLAGSDPGALFDTTTLTAPILHLLQHEARFAALSPKFALLADGGERLAALDHPHDIWLAAATHGERLMFMFGLAGGPGDAALGAIEPQDVPTLLRALLHAFLDLAEAGQRRMRDVRASHGSEAVLLQAQRYLNFTPTRDEAVRQWRRTPVDTAARLGTHALRADGSGYVGAQPALGRLDAATLDALASLAQSHGAATLRITPWQGVLLPGVASHQLAPTLTQLSALGLITECAAPLARLIACAGSEGCAKSRADTKADALRLAARLRQNAPAEAHLSGCERSCAAAHRAAWTLLAVAPDCYDLYARDEAAAGFGRLVAPHLTIDAAADVLSPRPRSIPNA